MRDLTELAVSSYPSPCVPTRTKGGGLIFYPRVSNSFPLCSTCILQITLRRTRNRTVLRQRHDSDSSDHSTPRGRQISRDLTQTASTVAGTQPPSSPIASSSTADSS